MWVAYLYLTLTRFVKFKVKIMHISILNISGVMKIAQALRTSAMKYEGSK